MYKSGLIHVFTDDGKNKNKIEAKLWWQEKEELRDMFALRVKILGGGKMCGVDGENVSSTEFQ